MESLELNSRSMFGGILRTRRWNVPAPSKAVSCWPRQWPWRKCLPMTQQDTAGPGALPSWREGAGKPPLEAPGQEDLVRRALAAGERIGAHGPANHQPWAEGLGPAGHKEGPVWGSCSALPQRSAPRPAREPMVRGASLPLWPCLGEPSSLVPPRAPLPRSQRRSLHGAGHTRTPCP